MRKLLEWKNRFAMYVMCSGLVLTILFSCDTQEAIPVRSVNEYDKNLGQLSSLLASKLSNPQLRSFIKKEALKQFDGDYDILLAAVLDKDIATPTPSSKRSITFKEALLSEDNFPAHTDGRVTEGRNDFLDSLISKYPLLQISVPEVFEGSTEIWDLNQNELLVAYLPSDYDEKTTKVITAYDKSGALRTIDAVNEPLLPVIVISNNERLQVSEEKSAKKFPSTDRRIYFSNKNYTYCFISDDYNTIPDNSIARIKTFDRDNNGGADVLWKGRFVSKDAFRQVEGWPSGRPEFRVIVAYLDKGSGTPVASTVEKILNKDGWIKRYVVTVKIQTKTINVPMFRWYKERYGSDMKYTWIELDGGSSTELAINVSSTYSGTATSATVKTTIGKDDDKAGEAIVQYENSTSGDGTGYNTGILNFWINQP